MKKYELTKEGKYYRITALRDFGRVKAGDIGGLVESEDNLSQEGGCWVDKTSCAIENSRVLGESYCESGSIISGRAILKNSPKVCDGSLITDDCVIYGGKIKCSSCYGYAVVGAASVENSVLRGNASALGDSVVKGSILQDRVMVFGHAIITSSKLSGNARVSHFSEIGHSKISGDSLISCDFYIKYADITGDAEIRNPEDYFTTRCWWSEGEILTWTKSNGMWKLGDFHGTKEELIKLAYEKSTVCGMNLEMLVKCLREKSIS